MMRQMQNDLIDGRLGMDSDFIQAAHDVLARYRERENGLKELTRMSEDLGLYEHQAKAQEEKDSIPK